MSAICGVVGLDGRPWQPGELAGVRDVLAALGPDGGGHWSGGCGRARVAVAAALAHRTPEDTVDRQPVTSEDGSVVVVADVRLDNRSDLVAALGGFDWTSKPDSGLILAAYQKWGFRCLDRLVGVYALAVVDRPRGGVLLARDGLGVRPLVIHERRGLVAFASNALALTGLEGVGHRLDERRAREALFLSYSSDRTFVEGVRWVQPGQAVWVGDRGVRRWQWWRPDPGGVVDFGSPEGHAEALRSVFDEAVGAQLRSTGSVGALVSGGLDSPSVAATAGQLLAPAPLRTYTSVPPPGWQGAARKGWDADESSLVQELAARYPNLCPSFVDISGMALLEGRYEPTWELGGGPPRNPCNQTWIDALDERAAADGITTLLSGAMGNLAFSADGPEWLWSLLRSGRLSQLMSETRSWGRHHEQHWAATLRHQLAPSAAPLIVRRLRRWRTGVADPVVDWLAATALRPGTVEAKEVIAAHPDLDPGRRLPYRLALWAAISDAAGQADTVAALTARRGLDHRDPTADRRVLELALHQPEWARRHDGWDRAVARVAMADRLPAAIVWRTRRGEQLPDWLDRMTDARSELASELDATREHPLSRSLIDTERLAELLRAWPDPTRSADPEVIDNYRSAMLRALVVSRYLRWFEDRGRARGFGTSS